MAMTMEANLVALRAEALVVAELTSRPDARVVEAQEEAFDLVAIICKRSQHNEVRFGIQVKAILPASVGGAFVRNARNGQNKTSRRVSPQSAFPICEMIVNVVSGEISWRWLLEPIGDNMGNRLESSSEAILSPLNEEAIDTIIDAVECWQNAI